MFLCVDIRIHARVPIAFQDAKQAIEQRVKSYKGVNVFIVCYSVFWKKALDNVASFWIPEIQSACPDVPFILVGTKTDFRPGYPGYVAGSLDIHMHLPNGEKPEFVDYLEAKEFAGEHGAQDYLECAAKAGNSGANGVNAVFSAAAKVAESHMPSDKDDSCSCCLM